jgi:hypothetical protein
MAADNSTDNLKHLPAEVLAEVVREGELMMQAQLQAYLATDQRAFTFAGLMLTAATGSFGAAIALSRLNPPDRPLAEIAAWFAIGLIVSAGVALATAIPRKFCLPGNEPKNWDITHWETGKRDLKQALLSQAKILQSQLAKNRKSAKLKGIAQRASFIIAYLTCLICGVRLAWVLDLL